MNFQVTSDGRVKVFVDGCYVPESESSKGGVGVWFNASHHLNCALEVNTKDKDNNDIELMAAQKAIDIFEENYDKEHSKSLKSSKNFANKLLIYTDSQHVVHHKASLKARHTPVIQRVDDHHAGIREADKLARKGAGIQ